MRTLASLVIGLLVGLTTIAVLRGPALIAPAPSPVAHPTVPSTLAPHSWWTGTLSSAPIQAANLLYQNGSGVELLDTPQSVLLGSDGSSYRRLTAAEQLARTGNQGDPAPTVLSADGRFVVIGGSEQVVVLHLRDGQRTVLPVEGGSTPVPLAISADGETVWLALHPRRDLPTSSGQLAQLDLRTGEVHRLPLTGVLAAAPSPAGPRVAVQSEAGVTLVEAGTGQVEAVVPGSAGLSLNGDSWSADGSQLAMFGPSPVPGSTGSLVVAEVANARPVTTALPTSLGAVGTVLGWRDASTVLLHGLSDGQDNTSAFYWVDTRNGRSERISSYTPSLSGASLVTPDAARDLIPGWRVEERPVDRGPLPWLAVGGLALLLGGIAGGLGYNRRRPPGPLFRTDSRELAGVS